MLPPEARDNVAEAREDDAEVTDREILLVREFMTTASDNKKCRERF